MCSLAHSAQWLAFDFNRVLIEFFGCGDSFYQMRIDDWVFRVSKGSVVLPTHNLLPLLAFFLDLPPNIHDVLRIVAVLLHIAKTYPKMLNFSHLL